MRLMIKTPFRVKVAYWAAWWVMVAMLRLNPIRVLEYEIKNEPASGLTTPEAVRR